MPCVVGRGEVDGAAALGSPGPGVAARSVMSPAGAASIGRIEQFGDRHRCDVGIGDVGVRVRERELHRLDLPMHALLRARATDVEAVEDANAISAAMP